MPIYALVGPGNTIVRETDLSRLDLNAGTAQGHVWLPVVNVDVGTPGPNTIISDPVDTFPGDQVTRTTTHTAMSQVQIDARDLLVVTSETDRALGKGLYLAFNILFFLVNDVRVRHGEAALTLPVFRNNMEALNAISKPQFRTWMLTITRT